MTTKPRHLARDTVMTIWTTRKELARLRPLEKAGYRFLRVQRGRRSGRAVALGAVREMVRGRTWLRSRGCRCSPILWFLSLLTVRSAQSVLH
jgi:hypothetical protein